MLDFPAGVTLQSVVVLVDTNARLDGGTLELHLSDATGAVLEDSIAIGQILPTGADSDAIPSIVELLASNEGDGNFDGVLDMRQNNVVSIPLVEISEPVTLVAPSNSVFTQADADGVSSELATLSNVAFPAGEISYALTADSSTSSVTLHFTGGLPIDSWYQFGPTEANPTPHWYEFLFDGEHGRAAVRQQWRWSG